MIEQNIFFDAQNSQVFHSVSDKKYTHTKFDARLALRIYQDFEVCASAAKILSSKNIEYEQIFNYLNPTLKEMLPNPFDLLDMDLACQKLIQVITANKKIVIFGDYDVDGATSSATLTRFFNQINYHNHQIYIPDRILEGYGPNSKALLKLKEQGADLIITVDCGTVAFDALKDAQKAGLEVIVIDHHLGANEKPAAIAVVNPNRIDETSNLTNLCAAGVCFLMCVALNKNLREIGYYQKNTIKEPNLLHLLDLTALGTICDVVPLTNLNRAFVRQGLKIMNLRQNLGINAICNLTNLNEAINIYHLGFVIGPRINAGGRVGQSHLGACLLSSDNESQVNQIAKQLDEHNTNRKAIEADILDQAIKQYEDKNNKFTQGSVVFIIGKNWHPGVIGIVASRIKELANKPCACIAIGQDNIAKASCRSINGVDFGAQIVNAKANDILIAGGGHKMAAGFSRKEENLQQLYDFLCSNLNTAVKQARLDQTFNIADILDINSCNLQLAQQLENLGPFGSSNPKPRFLIKDLIIIKSNLIGAHKNHINCLFSSKSLKGLRSAISGICFNVIDTPMADILISKNNSRKLNIVGYVDINNWMGNKKIQILIEDIIL